MKSTFTIPATEININVITNILDERDYSINDTDITVAYDFPFQKKDIEQEIEEANKTYDVVFDDSENSNSKGFKESLKYCLRYIEKHNGSDESYFKDYKGGKVSIIDNASGDVVYSTSIPSYSTENA
jgi:hypothetical protein